MQSSGPPASSLKKTKSWSGLPSLNLLGTDLELNPLYTSQVLHSLSDTQENLQSLKLVHERSPTTIINDVSQSYCFLQDFQDSHKLANSSLIDKSGEVQLSYLENQEDKDFTDIRRTSFFASTIESRSPYFKSDGSPKQSNLNTLTSEASAKAYQNTRREKNGKSWLNTEGMGRSDLGYAPSRMFCINCSRYVGTEVKFEFKKLSFWEKLCCGVCYGSSQKGEVILHRCRFCLSLLAKIYAKDLC